MKNKKILILSSNPHHDLKLNREIEDLKNIIKRAHNDSQFEIEFALDVQTEKLQELFIEYQPRIVHFCGHGTGKEGLILQNQDGYAQLVGTEALSNLFGFFDNTVECVVLNACYSEIQANTIVQHINYAIGMSHQIRDDAAIAFATGFYRWLSRGNSIEDSYQFGRNAIQLQINQSYNNSRFRHAQNSRQLVTVEPIKSTIIPEYKKPVLKKKSSPTIFPDEVSSEISRNHPEVIELEKLKQAIAEEGKRKQYRDRARDTWDEFGQTKTVTQPLDANEYRQRQTLLTKVRDFWIEGFLKPSLSGYNAIDLDWKNQSRAAINPFAEVKDIPIELDDSFEELQTTSILNQTGQGKTLLILGEPGSGKTIALLQLAEKAIEQSQQDLTKPIPVVFNLSSWGYKQQPIEKWLIEEFKHKYQVPRMWSELWIQQQQLILLLDGLDEVAADKRNACVRALNQFITNHNLTEMVVCSRVRDYEALTERLQLSSAVCIKPLAKDKVYQFLDRAGTSLASLKTLLQHDKELEQFVQTPLILNIMSAAYRDWLIEDLLQEFDSGANRYQHLFDNYIARMLSQKEVATKYSKGNTKHWLSWLANKMTQASQSVFAIEQMQPNWLLTNTQRRLYQISNILTGTIAVLLILLLGYLFDSSNAKIDLLNVLAINAVMWGLAFWWNFRQSKAEIKTFETLTYPWKKSRKDLLDGLIYGLSWSRILSPIGIVWCYITWKEPKDNFQVIVFGIILGLILGLIIGLIRGLRGSEIKTKTFPNQGIWNSAKNAVIVAILSWLILMPIILFPSPIGLFPQGLKSVTSVISWGLILGLLFGGGTACIQHFSLRLILWLDGSIPRNLARFLDYGCDRILIQKIGGGYIFVHRMLLEHFAQKYPIENIPVSLGDRNIPLSASYLICSNCTYQNPLNHKFCSKCGNHLHLFSKKSSEA